MVNSEKYETKVTVKKFKVMYQNVPVSQWWTKCLARGPNQEKTRRLFMYKSNAEARSCNHCRGRAVSIA